MLPKEEKAEEREMKMTDGRKAVEIILRACMGDYFAPDMSNDFFDVGGLRTTFDDVIGDDVYMVDDVEYCIDQANDWANYRNDYHDPLAKEFDAEISIERIVNINIL